MQGPCVAPEKRPSVTRAQSSSIPRPMMRAVVESISRMPGPPLGPSYRMTRTVPFSMVPALTAASASSMELNTRARPENRYMEGLTPDCFTTAPSGARLPQSTAMPPSGFWGCSMVRITSFSTGSTASSI